MESQGSQENQEVQVADYDSVYKRLDYAPMGVSCGLRLITQFTKGLKQFKKTEIRKFLVVGGGPNYETAWLRHYGYDVWGIEVSDYLIDSLRTPLCGTVMKGSVDAIPFKDNAFDVGVCCEVFEHIHPDMTDDALDELRRVSTLQILSIGCSDDPFTDEAGNPVHINIREVDWWREKIREHGMTPFYELKEMRVSGDAYLVFTK